MTRQNLTSLQRDHIARVFPGCRAEMSRYLEQGVAVGVCCQTEVEEAPPYAIFVMEAPDFWIDCCESHAAAQARARDLDLTVV